MFRNPFSFKGRIRRTEFGLSLIISLIAFRILYYIALGHQEAQSVIVLLFFPIYWFVFAQGAKREHDLGFSGWWQIFPLRFIWLIFLKGQQGENKYGTDPKEKINK